MDDVEITDAPEIEQAVPIQRAEKLSDLDLDAMLEKEEEPKEEVKEEVKEVKKEVKEAKAEEEKEEEEIEGYYADEGLEEEDDAPAPQPTVQAPVQTGQQNLTPLQEYFVQNLQPVTVTGKVNGQPVTLQAYTDDDLPAGFEYYDPASQRQYERAFNRIEAKAEVLADRFLNAQQAQQQQQESQQYSQRERRDIAQDIAKLQRDGEIPTFTPGVSVDEDPRAETARQVLQFYEDENKRRLDAANSNGRLYHHLSYEDAYYIWKQRQGAVNTAQSEEDKERKDIAKRQPRNNTRGADVTKQPKRSQLPSNASWDDIINDALTLY